MKFNESSLFHRALNACQNGVVITDALQADAPIVYINPAFTRITGYEADEVLTKNCRFLQNQDHDQAEIEKIHSLLAENNQGEVILRNYRKDGSLFWNQLHLAPLMDEQGNTTHHVGMIIDVTERKLLEMQLIRQATHDALTNLPNRNLLIDRIQQGIAHARRMQLKLAVIFFDLDNFKMINDVWSHQVGDEVLKTTAERGLSCIRTTDTFARLSGDEFVIVINDLSYENDVIIIIKKLQAILLNDIMIEDHLLEITASIGVSFYPKDGEDSETLLKHADIAMYWAKEIGFNNFQFYDIEKKLQSKKLIEFETQLRQAIVRKELVLHYQPIIDTQTGKIVAAEALVRWPHTDLGLILPNEFLPVAERIGLMIRIDEWVLHEACQQNKKWQIQNFPAIKIAVNVTGSQFKSKNFVSTIESALLEIGLAAKYLEIELSESIVTHDQKIYMPELDRLKKLGIGIVIDDFGIGYSALASIKYLSADKLKIDQSFIRNLTPDSADAFIVTAIISIAKKLKLKVVAEGVETRQQLELLREIHCDEVQGFYFSKAIPAESFAELLKKEIIS